MYLWFKQSHTHDNKHKIKQSEWKGWKYFFLCCENISIKFAYVVAAVVPMRLILHYILRHELQAGFNIQVKKET